MGGSLPVPRGCVQEASGCTWSGLRSDLTSSPTSDSRRDAPGVLPQRACVLRITWCVWAVLLSVKKYAAVAMTHFRVLVKLAVLRGVYTPSELRYVERYKTVAVHE